MVDGTPTPDYTPYVMAVYGLAALVYGGLTLLGHWRLKGLKQRLDDFGHDRRERSDDNSGDT
ncbi:MAG: heme exporter protein CcmD [Magnetococcales bacterium]|nr:heme exporter protein CcmD [Magnetococcales bacterium]